MHKTKEICDKGVDASLPTLKFAIIGFFTHDYIFTINFM